MIMLGGSKAMRELTFKGFLKQYVKDLSYQHTNNIYKLVQEAEERNPRLYEPLVLYATLNNKTSELEKAISNHSVLKKDLLKSLPLKSIEYDKLPDNYAKVYSSYLSAKNRSVNDAHTKQLMHNKIQRLKTEKDITNYKIYRDLNLNHGNFNSFMKNKDPSKVSLDTLRNVIDYLESR